MTIGGVAAGWAGEHNDIRLELVADDQKAVELTLINADVSYRAGPMRSADAPPQLYIDTRAGGVRLTILDERAARSRRRDEMRIDAAALEKLLEAGN